MKRRFPNRFPLLCLLLSVLLLPLSTTACLSQTAQPGKQPIAPAIEIPLPPGGERKGVFLIDWLDEGRLVFGLQGGADQQSAISLYVCDLENKTSSLFYQANDVVGYETTIKHLRDGALAFQCREKIIFFNKETLQKQREIPLPPNTRGVDLSSDGRRLIFCDEQGLHVADADLSNRKLLVKRTGENLRTKAPFRPKWSDDDSRLSYILCLYEGTEGVGVMNPDGTGHRFFSLPDVSYTYWLNDNRQILCGQSDYDQTTAQLIDTTSGNRTNMDIERNKYEMKLDPADKRVAYALRFERQEPYTHEMTLYVRDVKSDQARIASPTHYLLRNVTWSLSGRQLAYSTVSQKGDTKVWIQPLN
ncbi:hypothetical protein GTO91_05650 [Heliobacterium undosum]|uniref:Translocation protein TolB n=1 Tax=Heliomicrobium undosum TaxID=121734 RepID=A0A845L8E2_9FIRM|nr:hypothetical protein [Heliomicrobium undosum]MZP29191.1 hypothetical protein [Heliomicrobium undosum]